MRIDIETSLDHAGFIVGGRREAVPATLEGFEKLGIEIISAIPDYDPEGGEAGVLVLVKTAGLASIVVVDTSKEELPVLRRADFEMVKYEDGFKMRPEAVKLTAKPGEAIIIHGMRERNTSRVRITP